MAFSAAQNRIAVASLALMAASAAVPPWHVPGLRHLEYHSVWGPPPGGRVAWPAWCEQSFILATGMLLLLFLRERAERVRVVAMDAAWLAAAFE